MHLISLAYKFFCTASHLPYNRNGFKFFTNAGGLGKADIKDILERAASIYDNFSAESLKKSEQAASTAVRRVDYMAVYTSGLVKAVRKAAGDIGTQCLCMLLLLLFMSVYSHIKRLVS